MLFLKGVPRERLYVYVWYSKYGVRKMSVGAYLFVVCFATRYAIAMFCEDMHVINIGMDICERVLTLLLCLHFYVAKLILLMCCLSVFLLGICGENKR